MYIGYVIYIYTQTYIVTYKLSDNQQKGEKGRERRYFSEPINKRRKKKKT